MPLSGNGWEGERIPMTRKSGDRPRDPAKTPEENAEAERTAAQGCPKYDLPEACFLDVRTIVLRGRGRGG
jgi:hypothetical protein